AVPPPGGRPSAQAFLVPPGMHSLRLSSNVPALVRLAGPLGGGARFGDVPVVVDEGAELMLPDERRFALFIARPDALPVEVATVGPEADDLARLMRIDARLLAAGPDLSPCTVNVEFVDGTDTPQIEQLEVNAPRAPFELVETPAGERLRVSEPQSFRLAVAPSVTALRITADQPVAVRPQVLFPTPPPHLALPYRLHQPPEMIWRYALRDFRNWHPVNPTNRAALREGDQVFTLIPQARLELRGDGDGSEDPELRPGRFQAIEPLGRPPQQAVFESVAPENVGTVRARFGPGVYSAVPFGREVNLRIAAGDAARPRLRVLVEGEASRALGHGLEVFIDGESVAMVPISATRESRTLPPLTAGVHRFEVRGDVPAEAVDLYVDRRVDGVRVVQARTLYALDRRHLRVRVPMPGGRAVTLNAIVYDRDRKADAGTVVRAVIDEGQPRRRLGEAVGTVTLAEKIETLPAARTPLTVARLIDRRGESAGHPRTVPIHLGADLAPGPHLVDIWLEKGSPKWVRFIIADELLTEGERARTRTFTETKGRR
ncbi:MAG: hypothetical protein KC620_22910, partial [Myxococcales bacterium]|nr:hypothetical protein [Myxococcales bacterium]